MIPINDLEPGGVYQGPRGQVREIVSLSTGTIKYRMLERGYRPGRVALPVGAIGTVSRWKFSDWALKEVA